MKTKYLLAFFFMIFAAKLSFCQENKADSVKSLFNSRKFGQYFFSDPYAPINNLGLGLMLVANEYDIASNPRLIAPVAEPKLGTQIPWFYKKAKTHQFALSTPVSFSVWFDFTENRTSPILNTDYRFGVIEFNYNKSLKSKTIQNIGVKILPFNHESTHIGDELLISRIRDSIPAARINVSYEYLEAAIQVNDPFQHVKRNHSFKIGAKILWNKHKGFYSVDSLEVAQGINIPPTTRWIEPYFQYQFQNPKGFLSNRKMMFVASQDFYLRVRFGYPFSYTNLDGTVVITSFPESYQLCSTSMIGWKFLKSNGDLSHLGAFFKLYLGINPHGQFRNIPAYPWLGINIIYDI